VLPTDVGEKDTLEAAEAAVVAAEAAVVAAEATFAATVEVIASAGATREPMVVCALDSVKMTNIEKIITRINRGVNTYDQKRTIEYAILWSMTI
jgi:dihydroxyacetone kinase-like predicted kinase